jgi:hypothetical protein
MGKHINVDLSDWKRFEKDLKNFKKTALPYAAKAYVNAQG